MPVGGFYVDASGLDELAEALNATAGGVKDLSKVYREIGKKAEWYVRGHEPIYGGPTKGRQHTVHLQDHTKGGGGKSAWVKVAGVPYIYVQEFGGSAFWSRLGAGSGRAIKRAVRAKTYAAMKVSKGHIIYTKPRKALGYFLWNTAYRLRAYIGERMTTGIEEIGAKHGLKMDVTDRNLDIEQKPWNRAA